MKHSLAKEVFKFVLKNKKKNNLFVLKPTKEKVILNVEMFKTVETQNKRQKVSSNTYLWHLRLGHNNLNKIERLVKSGLLN